MENDYQLDGIRLVCYTILYITYRESHGDRRGRLVADSEWLLYALLAGGAVATALVLLYATRMRKPNRKPLPAQAPIILPAEAWSKRFSLSTDRTVTIEEAKEAKEKLKMLDLEREILSFAIRRLYEAQAEGKITEEEREQIAQLYKNRMMSLRDSISKSESVVALHELESMQQDLVKLFSERFDDLGKKVEDLRSRLEIKAEKEEAEAPTEIALPQAETEETPEEAEKEKEKRKPRKKPATAPTPKTEAEKRIDEIRSEVEKVLERLGQIEVEGES